MKAYRCIFRYRNGLTTMHVAADDADHAIFEARQTIDDREAETIEVWDETGLVKSHRRDSAVPK